jgi:hypothetical protein
MAATVVEAAVGSAEEAIVTDTASGHALSGIQLFVHWALHTSVINVASI